MIAALLYVIATGHPYALLAAGFLFGLKAAVLVWFFSPALFRRRGIPATRRGRVLFIRPRAPLADVGAPAIETARTISEPASYLDDPYARGER